VQALVAPFADAALRSAIEAAAGGGGGEHLRMMLLAVRKRRTVVVSEAAQLQVAALLEQHDKAGAVIKLAADLGQCQTRIIAIQSDLAMCAAK